MGESTRHAPPGASSSAQPIPMQRPALLLQLDLAPNTAVVPGGNFRRPNRNDGGGPRDGSTVPPVTDTAGAADRWSRERRPLRTATAIPDFRQVDPAEDRQPTPSTETTIAYDPGIRSSSSDALTRGSTACWQSFSAAMGRRSRTTSSSESIPATTSVPSTSSDSRPPARWRTDTSSMTASAPELFYARRIGRAPPLSVQFGVAEYPDRDARGGLAVFQPREMRMWTADDGDSRTAIAPSIFAHGARRFDGRDSSWNLSTGTRFRVDSHFNGSHNIGDGRNIDDQQWAETSSTPVRRHTPSRACISRRVP